MRDHTEEQAALQEATCKEEGHMQWGPCAIEKALKCNKN